MKALVVYDSVYGNTEKIALAITGALGDSDEVKTLRAAEVNVYDLEGLDLLIVGSPTQGGRPIKATKAFLDTITQETLKNVRVACFDTRFSEQDSGFWLRLIVKFFGYAAGRIEKKLVTKGGKQVIAPEGFIVEGTEGPLKEGELEKAAEWGKQIRGRMSG